ncbi:hypothetical protein D3C71_2042880 [compost metagenome]
MRVATNDRLIDAAQGKSFAGPVVAESRDVLRAPDNAEAIGKQQIVVVVVDRGAEIQRVDASRDCLLEGEGVIGPA